MPDLIHYEIGAFITVWARDEATAIAQASEFVDATHKGDGVTVSLEDGPPLIVDWEGAS